MTFNLLINVSYPGHEMIIHGCITKCICSSPVPVLMKREHTKVNTQDVLLHKLRYFTLAIHLMHCKRIAALMKTNMSFNKDIICCST